MPIFVFHCQFDSVEGVVAVVLGTEILQEIVWRSLLMREQNVDLVYSS